MTKPKKQKAHKQQFKMSKGSALIDGLAVAEYAKTAQDGNYKLTIELVRNGAQNRLLHRHIEEWRLAMFDTGDSILKGKEAKFRWKLWIKHYEVVKHVNDDKIPYMLPNPKPTKDLSVVEMHELLTHAKFKFINDFGYEPESLMDEALRELIKG